jgi:hypothetical protein
MVVHEELDELFARHRDLVVGLEFARAAQALTRFAETLLRHKDFEDRYILPLYEERAGRTLGGHPELFRLEHKNLARNLEEVILRAKALAADPSAGRRQAHEFLAAEWMFMHLWDHHGRRERNVLYPELDRLVTDDERAELLAQNPARGPI